VRRYKNLKKQTQLVGTATGPAVDTKALTSTGTKLRTRSPTPGPGDKQVAAALAPSQPVAPSSSSPVGHSARTSELLARLREDGVNASLEVEGDEEIEEIPEAASMTEEAGDGDTNEDDTGDEEEDQIMLREMRRLLRTNGEAQPLWKETKQFDHLTSGKWKHARR
jgi:hypothetical protein